MVTRRVDVYAAARRPNGAYLYEVGREIVVLGREFHRRGSARFFWRAAQEHKRRPADTLACARSKAIGSKAMWLS